MGGLLEHTLSVTKLCDYFCTAYPVLKRDLLLTAAICHDMGKVRAEPSANQTPVFPDAPKYSAEAASADYEEILLSPPPAPLPSAQGEYEPSDYLPVSSKDIEQMFRELLDIIESIENPYYKKLLYSADYEEILLSPPPAPLPSAPPSQYAPTAKITKVKKNYAYARLEGIIEPSKVRVEPVCIGFKQPVIPQPLIIVFTGIFQYFLKTFQFCIRIIRMIERQCLHKRRNLRRTKLQFSLMRQNTERRRGYR